MFSEKKTATKPKKRSINFHESAVTILTPGCHFNGKLYCKGSSRIGGRIEGEIVSEGLLIVEEEAIISACIQAEEAIIQGKVSGTLKASGRVELANHCCFEGDIVTPALVIHEGAQFNGKTSMPENHQVDKKKNVVSQNTNKEPRVVNEKPGAQAKM